LRKHEDYIPPSANATEPKYADDTGTSDTLLGYL
jgi:hypothetical protein